MVMLISMAGTSGMTRLGKACLLNAAALCPVVRCVLALCCIHVSILVMFDMLCCVHLFLVPQLSLFLHYLVFCMAASPPIILVCGGKDVGKSTFCRFLVNCLLNRLETCSFCDDLCCVSCLKLCEDLAAWQVPLFFRISILKALHWWVSLFVLCRCEEVAFLETDVGQTELTAPAILSLHCLKEALLGKSITSNLDWYYSLLLCLVEC